MNDCKYSSGGILKSAVSLADLQRLVRSGQLRDDDTVYVPAFGVWQPVRECRGRLLALDAQGPAPVAVQPDDQYEVLPAAAVQRRPPDVVPRQRSDAIHGASDDPVWYYTQGDSQRGPVSEAKLRELAGAGILHADDCVWRDGMPDWVTCSAAGLVTPRGHRVAGGFPPATPQSRAHPQAAASPVTVIVGQTAPTAGPAAGANGMATASLVLGILSLFCFGFIPGILAVIFGAIALNHPQGAGRGSAVAGLVLGIIGTLGWIAFLVLSQQPL